MCFPLFLIILFLLFFFLLFFFLFRGSISHADFPFPGEHFSCGFPSRGGGAFLMRIPFPGEHFSCGFPSGGAFLMRQVRGGEAFIVAKAIVPSSRSSPPGHAAVLRCGMCYFADGAMDSTILDIAGYADINLIPGNRPAVRAAFPSALIHRLSLEFPIPSNPSPYPKRITHHNVRSKKRARKGGARGGKTGFATLSAFPLANFRRETIPGSPTLYHNSTHARACAFIH